jgi:hypothetical protein
VVRIAGRVPFTIDYKPEEEDSDDEGATLPPWIRDRVQDARRIWALIGIRGLFFTGENTLYHLEVN